MVKKEGKVIDVRENIILLSNVWLNISRKMRMWLKHGLNTILGK